MNNFCKITILIICTTFIFSCTDKGEPFFEDHYVYKNTLPNSISIDFYRFNSKKVSIDIIDSVIINKNYNGFNSTFLPGFNDSIVINFYDGKKIIFRERLNSSSSNWNISPINSSNYKRTYIIDGNLTNNFYTYIVDDKIYELSK